MSFTAYGTFPQLQLQTATPEAGTALVNGTPTILTWTAPNDGQMHLVEVFTHVVITSLETGGAINIAWTPTGDTAQTFSIYAGGQGASIVLNNQQRIVAPGTTFTVNQTSALTGGAASIWAQLWGA